MDWVEVRRSCQSQRRAEGLGREAAGWLPLALLGSNQG